MSELNEELISKLDLLESIRLLQNQVEELKNSICKHERRYPTGKHNPTYGCTVWMCRDCGVLIGDKKERQSGFTTYHCKS